MINRKIVSIKFLGIRMELDDIEGNLFNAFFGAAYSVIMFGPIIIPLTNENFITETNFISMGLLFGTLIVSFWMLVKNSMDWSTEEIKSVSTNLSDLKYLVNDLKKKSEIKQISLLIFAVIPGIVYNIGLLNVHQVFVWIFSIMILLTLQFYESRNLSKFSEFKGGV
jgi:hypothetical protein